MRINAKNLKPGDINAKNGDVLQRTYTVGNTVGLIWETTDGDERRHHDDPNGEYEVR